mmetsp:Transcript_34254/g.68204  ORF Transcript_34254/g.68204 Transcript_34254/m.68204 type:complete len:271 (-) Transcript_34254:122-934(-)
MDPQVRNEALVASLSAAAATASATALVPRAFFVAWNGVLVLMFDGFPQPLVHIKGCLNETALELRMVPESFGSTWPKCTLAALEDAAEPLSLQQLASLKTLCEEHTLAEAAPVAVSAVSVVQYKFRGLEEHGLVSRTDVPLQQSSASGTVEPVAAAERERVDSILGEWADVESYHAHAAAPGSRISSYREASPAGMTCATFLSGWSAVRCGTSEGLGRWVGVDGGRQALVWHCCLGLCRLSLKPHPSPTPSPAPAPAGAAGEARLLPAGR